jgi:GNAT superfamily N-acetyltransferase
MSTIMKKPSVKLKIIDMNDAMENPKVLASLKELTLCGLSGMQLTLDRYEDILVQGEEIRGKAIVAYSGAILIAWGLLSWEPDDEVVDFDSSLGVYFQIFVDGNYRRQGIGTKLLARARKIIGSKERLNVSCWSNGATAFYRSNQDQDLIDLFDVLEEE